MCSDLKTFFLSSDEIVNNILHGMDIIKVSVFYACFKKAISINNFKFYINLMFKIPHPPTLANKFAISERLELGTNFIKQIG